MSDARTASFAPSFLETVSRSPWPRVTWGLFLLLVLVSLIAAFGAPTGTSFLLGSVVAVLFAWRYPYASFYAALATAPLFGIIVSISTGRLVFGERAFGGSIDVSLGELVAAAVLAAWAFRILMLWHGRRDWNWKPHLPLGAAFALLVASHAITVFSPAMPDSILVLKYALRPVALTYLISVALPVNFIRSRRRLLASLGVLTALGVFFALDGFRSLFSFGGELGGLHRARPLPILGVSPIGENHNVLAELMLFTAPAALALGSLTRDLRLRTYAYAGAAFMTAIALLTFARSAWIAFALESAIILATVWRPWVKANARRFIALALLLVPLAGFMLIFSTTPEVQSSTAARAALSDIAFRLFEENPLVGIGAGAFPGRVAQTRAFILDFGTALDAHGILQKILSETGLIGIAAFAVVIGALVSRLKRTLRRLTRREEIAAYTFLVAAVAGAFAYQLFNTTYWTAKLWLPVGIALAAGRALTSGREGRDPDFLVATHE